MSVKLKEDVLKMRFEDIYGDYQRGRLNCEEASRILGISNRTFLRKRDRYESEDFDGTFDQRIGQKSNNAALDEEIVRLIQLYQDRYAGFTVGHFYDHYVKIVKPTRSYNWCRNQLQKAGIVKKSKKGGPQRQRRERRPMEGMMIHQDGSTHEWIIGYGGNLDLIITMDDASSHISSGFLVDQEGTESSMLGIKETLIKKGLFCEFYSDRGSHYAFTAEAGGKVDKHRLTQVGRALKELGIKHILAYSPQARGRSERMFGTLQGRLPKELALRGITTIKEANKFINEEYLPEHNQKFAKPTSEEKSAYVPWLNHQQLDEILCLKEERVVNNDNTVRYNTKILQIPVQKHRYHYVKCKVEIREYLNKELGIFYGHLCLGRYDQAGNLVTEELQRKAA